MTDDMTDVGLLDLPGELLQGVLQPLLRDDLVVLARVCTRLLLAVRAHPYVAWLRTNANSDRKEWDAVWFEDDNEACRAEWGHPRACAALARDGRLDLLQWVRSHDPSCACGAGRRDGRPSSGATRTCSRGLRRNNTMRKNFWRWTTKRNGTIIATMASERRAATGTRCRPKL